MKTYQNHNKVLRLIKQGFCRWLKYNASMMKSCQIMGSIVSHSIMSWPGHFKPQYFEASKGVRPQSFTLPFSWLTARCCLRPFGDAKQHMATRLRTWAPINCRMVWPCSPLNVIRTFSNAPSWDPKVGTWNGINNLLEVYC